MSNSINITGGNADNCTNRDLLTAIIGGKAAEELLTEYPTFFDLSKLDLAQIEDCLTPVKAVRLWAALQVAKRIQPDLYSSRKVIRSSQDVADYYIPKLVSEQRESFRTLLLNSANQVFKENIVSVGSLNASIVHPREVFAPAITHRAASMILLHNHPSGNKEPSREDLAITRQLVDAGAIIDIKVLDHVIIAGREYTSFSERGLM